MITTPFNDMNISSQLLNLAWLLRLFPTDLSYFYSLTSHYFLHPLHTSQIGFIKSIHIHHLIADVTIISELQDGGPARSGTCPESHHEYSKGHWGWSPHPFWGS